MRGNCYSQRGGLISSLAPIVFLGALASLVLAALLLYNPEFLESSFPYWRELWALPALCFGGVFLLVYLFRLLKIVSICAFWGGVFFIIGTQIFHFELSYSTLSSEFGSVISNIKSEVVAKEAGPTLASYIDTVSLD